MRGLMTVCLAATLAMLPQQHRDLTRLRGRWLIDLRSSSAPSSTTHRGVATLELDTITRARQRVVEGPYTLSLQGITRPDACIRNGGTARLVRARGDSVRVDFQQGFGCGLMVVGVVRRDSLVGRWYQKVPSGATPHGRFTMSRLPS